jgi:adenylyl-sulfate kinase
MKKGRTIWFTGLSGSGKSTLASGLKTALDARGVNTILLDGDILRKGLNRDLGFSALDRTENIRRAGEIAKILTDEGYTVIAAFITPLEVIRQAVRSLFDPDCFTEIFLDCPLSECENRDVKGLYFRARKGQIPEFTGISAPFERPCSPDIVVSTSGCSAQESLDAVLAYLDRKPNGAAGNCSPAPVHGSGSKRVAVVGLDSVPAGLIFGEYRHLMPNVQALTEHGLWGSLRSTDPPITIPAWTSITSGKDPGELGLYGFRNRSGFDYNLTVADSSKVQVKRVWDHLEERGLKSALVGIPQTYPARPHNGLTVADFLAPRIDERFTYPPDLVSELNSRAGGGYMPDVKGFRTEDKDRLLTDLYAMVEGRFRLCADLLRREDWDFFMMVEIATDRLHHGFWRFSRKDHRLYEPGNPYENVMPDFYRYVDGKLASLLAMLDDDTTLIMVSDHGAKSMAGGVCVNEWLIRKGYLVLKQMPEEVTALTPELVDWSRTRAWSEGGYYARVFINVQGREPHGVTPAEQYEATRNEVAALLSAIPNGDGTSVSGRVLKPERLYRAVNGYPPDLIVYFDDLGYRSIGTVGHGKIHVYGNDTGPDDANHDHDGFFLCVRMSDLRKGIRRGCCVQGLNCLDITPTILNEFGLLVPPELGGKVLDIDSAGISSRSFESVPRSESSEAKDTPAGFTADEEEIVKRRLAELGYI